MGKGRECSALTGRDLSERNCHELSEGEASRSACSSRCSTPRAACAPHRDPARSAHTQHRGSSDPAATSGAIEKVTHTHAPHNAHSDSDASPAGSLRELQANQPARRCFITAKATESERPHPRAPMPIRAQRLRRCEVMTCIKHTRHHLTRRGAQLRPTARKRKLQHRCSSRKGASSLPGVTGVMCWGVISRGGHDAPRPGERSQT